MVLEHITTADYERAALLAQAQACQHDARPNERREAKGLVPLVLDRHGAHNSMLDACAWFIKWQVGGQGAALPPSATRRSSATPSMPVPPRHTHPR